MHNRFQIRAEKVKGVWCVDIEDNTGRRSRNSIPSYFKYKRQAVEYAKILSQNTQIPLKK